MTAAEVLPNIFVGGGEEAATWRHPAICVLETLPQLIVAKNPETGAFIFNVAGALPGELQLPILEKEGRATMKALNVVAEVIDVFYRTKTPVLIRCGAGVERAPLSVAWWVYSKEPAGRLTWNEAYQMVKKARPQTQDRTHWLPPETIQELR